MLWDRARAARAGVLLSAVVLVGCGSQSAHHGSASAGGRAASTPAGAVADGDWRTFDFNSNRSGVGPTATGITRSNVGSLELRVVHLNGVVDSSAIQLHSVLVGGRTRDVDVVTTTYGRTLAFDPATGEHLWEYTPKDLRHYRGSSQITTASPVADPSRRYVYTASPDGVIHKLALATGDQVWATRITFDPSREKIPSALNVSGRYIIATTGGYYGDQPPYQGHVAVITRASGHLAHVWNSLCSNRHHLLHPSRCPMTDSAIWARSGAVVEPGNGRLLVATGNGPFNGHTGWGDSVLELTPDASRLLHNWTPRNEASLNHNDLDLGSTAPTLIPGTALAVQAGKAGRLALLDLNRLNGTTGGPSPREGGQLQALATPGSAAVYSAPIAFRHAGKVYVVIADNVATAGYELSHRRLRRAWERHTAGTSPILAGGLLFVYDDVAGRLTVMDPVSGSPRASLAAAHGHWSSPIVVGGRVILPVGGSSSDNGSRGKVLVYHLPGR